VENHARVAEITKTTIMITFAAIDFANAAV
jgi:hypothetical protein